MEDAIDTSEDAAESKIKFLVEDVLAKKELRNLGKELVSEKVRIFLKEHKKINEKLNDNIYSKFRRSKKHRLLIKTVRADLREIYGVFIMPGYEKREKLFEKLKKDPSIENHNKILRLHKSSKERLAYYPIVYKKIFEITGKPSRIVDFACGLNPFSYPYLSDFGGNPDYLASDLAEKDLEFIREYFQLMKINGTTKRINLLKDDISDITSDMATKNDLVFLFKTLDSLETVKRNVSEQILKQIKAKFVVVSFSTKSLGGKKTIKKERRAWFEKLISRLECKFQSFEIPDETFYIISPK